MARTIDATGRSIDEAIFNGLKELEISIDEVEIDIIQQESKGILGIGAKPAIVRLTEREPEDVVLPEYLNPENQRRERGERREKRDRRDRRDRRERTESAEAAEGDAEAAQEGAAEAAEAGEEKPRRERRDRRRKGERERSDRREPKEPPEGFTEEAAEGVPAAEFLKGLLRHMNVEGTVLAKAEDEGIRLYIDKSTMGMLIGHRGETLDAMQYLTSLAVNRNRKQEGYTRVSIDTEGYREKREETLARLARKIAGQVKATGRSRTLEPMNPYERRVLHATLQNHPYVATRSEGEEPNRRVVIYLKDKAE